MIEQFETEDEDDEFFIDCEFEDEDDEFFIENVEYVVEYSRFE